MQIGCVVALKNADRVCGNTVGVHTVQCVVALRDKNWVCGSTAGEQIGCVVSLWGADRERRPGAPN